jgi:hypothetical protein
MRSLLKNLGPFLLAAALVSPVLITGCATPAQSYDSDHSDYHTWDRNEVVKYSQWEHDTHRDHQDFAKRNDAEQKEYYTWSHSHDDHH